jgi:Uma2 family endonuclease
MSALSPPTACPEGLSDGYAPFAPDLAVEVVSPNDSAEDIEKKVIEYLRYSTRMVWVFYPTTQTVVVDTPQGTQRLDTDGTLDGGDVLPASSSPCGLFDK